MQLLGEGGAECLSASASIPQDALTQDAWMELLFSAAASDQKAPLPKSPGGSYNGGAGGCGGNHRLRRVLLPRWMESAGSGADAAQEDITQETDGADQTTDGADSSADTSEDNGGRYCIQYGYQSGGG